MSFLSKLFFKYFGPSFIRKHITTVLGFLAGYLASLGLNIDGRIIDQFIGSGTEIIIALVLYFTGAVIDAKPETPKIINK
jgi:hypothetical protein